MEMLKGYEYQVDGHKDIVDFAKGILALTNAKCSRKGTIIDIKTIEGSNIVYVTTLMELDSEIKHFMGEILDKEEIQIMNIEDDYDEFNPKIQKKMKELWDKDIEYKVFHSIED